MRRPTFLSSLSLVLISATAACTLLLDREGQQCASNADCVHFAQDAVCRDSVCVAANGASGLDGGLDATYGPDGCIRDPKNNEELLNSCTSAQCEPFDNCAKLGLCDGKLLGPQPPEGATAAPPSTTPSPATESCSALAAQVGTQPVYVTGSSNFPSFLKSVAPLLVESGYSIVWQTSSSCEGVDKVYAANGLDVSKRLMKEKPGRVTQIYDANGNATPCLLDTNGNAVDVGESDVFGDSCKDTVGYPPTDPGVGSYLGPVQAMVYIVPAASTQKVISAEAAQAVFGRGGVPDAAKLPWNDTNQIFTRASSTGTNQILSRAMFIEPTKWWGVDKKTADNMVTQLKQVPLNLADKTIGVISTDLADKERGNLTALAFQAHGQSCGYWPDSTPFSRDKLNVRDGHYPVWGPIHFYTRLEGGAPTSAAGAFVLRFALPRLEESLVTAIAASDNVPECAMHVARDAELGEMRPYRAPYACDCLFEKITKGAPGAECKTCANNNECPSDRPACNYGYCEAQ